MFDYAPKQRLIRLILTLAILPLLTLALIASAQTNPQTPPTPRSTELLRDPAFTHGITQGYANHLTPAERADCLSRWQNKGVTNAQWAFWEISEQLHFAHNPATPSLPKPNTFIWSTTNQAKQCLIENGAVHILFDTSKEWREGGSLNLPDKTGARPKYGDPNTTWPHFLLGQHFAKDNNPSTTIPDADKLRFHTYDQLRLSLDIKLNRLQKSSTWDHRAEFGAANHAIFYVAIVLMPTNTSRLAETGKFYLLVPAIYSEGDNHHVPGSTPWLGLDQFGDGVYFSNTHPTLKAGTWTPYDIDVKKLIHEGLTAANEHSKSTGKTRTYRPEDYYLACLLLGWEIWGGFDTDVEFKNLSVKGIK